MENYGGYLGILKWTLEHSDGTKPSDVKEMSPERKEFLEKAMKDALVSDADKMKKILEMYKNPESSIDQKIECVEELEDYVLSIDNAKDFDTIHGFDPLLDTLKQYILNREKSTEDEKELVATICRFVGAIAQNDAYIQNCCLKNSVFSAIYALKYEDSPQLQAAIISAISSIVRGNRTGETYFLKNDGLQYLLSNLCTKNRKVVTKTMLLLSALTINNNICNVLNTAPFMDCFLAFMEDKEFVDAHCFILDVFDKLIASKSLNPQYQKKVKSCLTKYQQGLDDADAKGDVQKILNKLK